MYAPIVHYFDIYTNIKLLEFIHTKFVQELIQYKMSIGSENDCTLCNNSF